MRRGFRTMCNCMKIKNILLFFLLVSTRIANGQQIPQFSQYLWNNYLINPAIGGAENHLEIKAGYRDQWVGIEGAPKTMFFTIQGQLGKKLENKEYIDVSQPGIDRRPYTGIRKTFGLKPRKYSKPPSKYVVRGHHGVGCQLMNDRIGPFNTTALYLSYSYHIPISKRVYASLGVYLGAKQYNLNLNRLQWGDNASDPTINAGASAYGISPDGSIGGLVYSEKFYVGFASGQIFDNKVSVTNAANDIKGRLERHYFLNGGYRIKITRDLAIVPSTMIRVYPNTPASIDLNIKFNYFDIFWWGVSYRQKDALVGLVGMSVAKQWDIGYSYDYNTSPLNKFNSGTHEIVIGYRMINKRQNSCRPSYAW